MSCTYRVNLTVFHSSWQVQTCDKCSGFLLLFLFYLCIACFSSRVLLAKMLEPALAVVSFLLSSAMGEMVRVLDSRAAATRGHRAAAEYSVTLAEDPRADLPDTFTLCMSSFMANLNYPSGGNSDLSWAGLAGWAHRVFMYVNVEQEVEDIRMYFGVTMAIAWVNLEGTIPFSYNRWFHMCLRFDVPAETIVVVVEGTVLSEKVVKGLGEGKPTNLTGVLEIDSTWFTIANHMVSNVQVWGRGLSVEEMVGVTAGDACGSEGDYLAWGDMRWQVRG